MSPPTPEARPLAPGDVIAGKFRLESIVGRGGMGAVWAGRHLQLDMLVALKFIDAEPVPGVDPRDALVRFEREARAAAQIRSPHVAQIIDHGVDTSAGVERPYIAMELLEGEDLGQRLRRERRLSVQATARILSQAAKALRRAHEAGIIHRDLKPGNIFLARFDDDEVVKVLDFGVAKMRRAGAIEDQIATQTGVVFGSPTYMSPEQARGVRDLDHRTDLWSLAVIVFRALTGVKPFQGASIADIVIKLCIDPLPVATRVAPDLPPGVDRFFERAFARDPAQRFATATEMAAAFDAVAAEAPAHVPPPTAQTQAAATPEPPSGAQRIWALGAGGSGTAVLPPGGFPAMAAAQPSFTPSGGVPLQAPAASFTPSGGVPASPVPMGATPPNPRSGLLATGSGPQVGFGQGTLTQPTPASGAAVPPSGGWGLPPAPPPAQPPPAAEAPPPSPGAAPAIAPRPVSRPQERVVAAIAGVAMLLLMLVVVVTRRGPTPASPAAASATAEATPEPTAPDAPPGRVDAVPGPSASAAPPAEPAAANDADEAGAEDAGAPAAASGAPAADAPAAPAGTSKPGTKPGKKKKPNWGY